jgi:hypothetical protein
MSELAHSNSAAQHETTPDDDRGQLPKDFVRWIPLVIPLSGAVIAAMTMTIEWITLSHII